MKTLTTTPLVSLGSTVCLSIGLFGCKLPFITKVETKPDIIVISSQQSEVTYSNPATPSASEGNPTPEEPSITPPTESEDNKGNAIQEETAPAEVNPFSLTNGTDLPPIPNPSALPVLEQKPGDPLPLTAPGSVRQNPSDRLYYKSGDPQPYTGSAVLFYANGQRKFEGFFKNGLRDGNCLEWYANGKKHYEGKFQSGHIYKGSVYWYYGDSLALKLRGDYEKGKMVRGTHWDRAGALYR